MRYKVYQLQQKNPKVVLNENGFYDHLTYSLQMNVIAEYEYKNSDEEKSEFLEEVHNACNVQCWDSDVYNCHDKHVHTDHLIVIPTEDFRGVCNSDIAVETPKGLYKAESFGWTKVPSIEEAVARIIVYYPAIKWDSITNKESINLEDYTRIKSIYESELKEKENYIKDNKNG